MKECTECGSPVLARGWCRKHYLRWYKHGDVSHVADHKQYAARGDKHGGFVHGMHQHPLYKTWWHMLQRCKNPACPAYKDYGGRGIVVCERWHDIRAFIADMGDKPAGASLERVNNDLGYSPDNCVWAPRDAQARNRRNVKLTAQSADEMRSLRATGLPRKALAERFGVSEATVKKVLAGTYWRSAEKIVPTVADALKKR